MSTQRFDYAIIGAGAAGLNLALALVDDPDFRNKKIAIIEKSEKNTNDRTWCFWEKGDGKWDKLITNSWASGRFISHKVDHKLSLPPYTYKMLPAINFYQYALDRLKNSSNVVWIKESVVSLEEHETVNISTDSGNYEAKEVFDSRIDPDFKSDTRYLKVLQHFKGWVVHTEKAVFDPDQFVMMDFRVKYKDQTCFTYILPSSPHDALVEFTLFTPDLISQSDYEAHLKKYLSEILNTGYSIEEEENGIIPMSNYPFHEHHSRHITKIGTAGSWVKPSSGYSFKNAERFSQQIVNNLKQKEIPSKDVATSRHRKYDSLFLDILQNRNELGEKIFTEMYTRNSIQEIFRFLDEDTTIKEDLKIIASFDSLPFIKAIGRQLVR